MTIETAYDALAALIEASLARQGYNWAASARELEMDRANLTRLAKRLGVETEPSRRAGSTR